MYYLNENKNIDGYTQQQHVVAGIHILQPTPPTPTHQGISWVFPFLMRGFPSVILRTRVLIFARDDSHVVNR